MYTQYFRFLAYGLLILPMFSLNAQGASIEDYNWNKSVTPNFTVYSAVSEQKTNKIVRHLELFRQAALSSDLIQTSESAIGTEIYLLRKGSDFKKLGKPSSLSGLFTPGMRNNTILVKGASGINRNVTTLHEYSHFLLSNSDKPHYPIWAEEGMVQVLSHVTEEDDGLIFGDAPKELVAYLNDNHWRSLSEIITAKDFNRPRKKQTAMLYSLSWLIMNYLISQPDFEIKFSRYIQDYNNGIDDYSAFENAFGLNENQLKLEIKSHLRKKKFAFKQVAKDNFDGDFEITLLKMSRSEAALRLGQLALRFGQLDNAEHWFKKVTEDNHLIAQALSGLGDVHKFRGEFDQSEDYFSRVLDTDKSNAYNMLDIAEYWHRRAVTSTELDDQINYMDKARVFYDEVMALDSTIPELYVQLGLSHIFTDDKDAAMKMLLKAESLLPGNLSIRLLVAESLVDAGREEEALAKAQSILNAAHKSSNLFMRASAIDQRNKNAPTSE